SSNGHDQIGSSFAQPPGQGHSGFARNVRNALVKNTHHARTDERDAAPHGIRRAVQGPPGADKYAPRTPYVCLFHEDLGGRAVEVHAIYRVILEERHSRLLLT